MDVHTHPFSEAPKSIRFEGDDNKNDKIVRQNGEIDKVDFANSHGTISYSKEEIENLNINDIIEKVDKAAQDMARQKFNFMIGVIEESTKKTGNIVQMREKGKLEPEDFFELIRKIWIDFNDDNEPIFPSILVGSKDQINQFQEMFKKIDADRKLKLKFDELIDSKRNEFNARENSRKLVE